MSPPKDTYIIQTNEKEEQSVIRNKKKYNSVHLFLIVCIVGVTLCKGLEILNLQNRSNVPVNIANDTRPKYWLFMNRNEEEIANLSKYVQSVLGRIGYVKSTNESPWDLLWSMSCAFDYLYPRRHTLKPHQRVNHFPGTYNLTTKVAFSIIESKYKPKAFQLPEDKEGLLKYASENPKAVFVEKNVHHGGVVLKDLTEMNMEGDTFAQEFLPNPLLVDGFKFEVGVYVAITSVHPLRVYYYTGDILFRYCLEKYHPFVPLNLRKYVVGDNYRYSSQVPALASLHSKLGFGMKEAFDLYVSYKGKDPAKMWGEVHKALREIFINAEIDIIEELEFYPSNHNFFELLRVDFMVDENMNVYLLEVNKGSAMFSPNPDNEQLYEQGKDSAKMWTEMQKAMREIFLNVEQDIIGGLKYYASKHNFFEMLRVDFMVDEDMNVYLLEVNLSPSMLSPNPANKLLYDQVLYSLFSLVGLSGPMRNYLTDVEQQDCGTNTTDDHHAACMKKNAAAAMLSADKNIAVFGDVCNRFCKDCEYLCTLCLNCLSPDKRRYFLHAYREHLHRGEFRRIFPPAMTPYKIDERFDGLTLTNLEMSLWYQGKCDQDVAWCT